jgi:3-oxoacyl-[acyl-carrier-protein] synthase-3
MTQTSVVVRGIASAVPATVASIDDAIARFGSSALKVAESTGVRARSVAGETMCSSDLCYAAATRLLAGLNWEPHTVDVVLMVTQTPDYILPATSCSLHARLGLSKHCTCFDVNLGCSGYVVGLWLANSLLQSGAAKRVLVLAGDTISRTVSPDDRSVAMLFGDGGTATALELAPGDGAGMVFELGTDGSGARHIMIAGGGFRHPRRADSTAAGDGRGAAAPFGHAADGRGAAAPFGHAADGRGAAAPFGHKADASEHLFMNGAEVFAFALREVPPLVRAILDKARWTLDDVDAVVMHQANRFILEHLGKKLQIPRHKLVVELESFGNTSSASIPLAISHGLGAELEASRRRLLLAGFGVGLSWAGAALSCGPMFIPPVIALAADGATSDLPRG